MEITLRDLRTGYVVRFRNGECGLVLEYSSCRGGQLNIIVCAGNKAYKFDQFKKDMTHVTDSKHDIIKVYRPNHYPNIENLSDFSDSDLVWRRTNKRKMTVEEISRELGCDIEIVW